MADPVYISKALDYEIKDGVMHISSGGEPWCCMSLATFEKGLLKAQGEIARWKYDQLPDKEKAGKPVPMRRRR